MLDLAQWYASAAGTAARTSGLDNAKTIADSIQALVTAAAILVGGIWAYFKFAQGRTFRPRIEVDVSGQWRDVRENKGLHIRKKKLLHARIRVKNIGLSKI